MSSEPTCEHQHQQNQYDQTQATARPVAPTAAMRPRWNRAEQHQNRYNDQNVIIIIPPSFQTRIYDVS